MEGRNRDGLVVVTLAGGYAARVEDTVTIHVGTIRAGKEVIE